MKRFLASVLSLATTIVLGCGYSSYELRLQTTEARLKDEMKLDQVLAEPVRADFEKNNVYLRPPKTLQQAAEFTPYPGLPLGMFDLEASFLEPVPQTKGQQGQGQAPAGGLQLHVLARRTQDESAAPKEKPAEAVVAADRGPFVDDLRRVLIAAYGPEAESAQTETINVDVWPRTGRKITFDRLKLTGPENQLVQVYLHHQEAGQAEHDTALIWEVPGGQAPTATDHPVNLTLGTFAVGTTASQRFRGVSDDEVGVTGGGPGGEAPLTPF